MRTISTLALLFLFAFMSIAIPSEAVEAAQESQKSDKADKDKSEKSDKKKEENKAEDDPNAGRPVLWQEPRDIESRDLFYGPGGREGAPDPSGKFTFLRRSSSGTSEKIIVKDDKGREWTVKFGPEARPETTATRIVWAVGYHVDQTYFVERTHIEGRGGFDVWDVRFERRDDGYKDLGPWLWDANPFKGTRELQGLKVIMALLNNWDLKDVNNKIVRPNKESGGDRSLRVYYVSDLGGTLGATGNPFKKIIFIGDLPAGSKGNPGDYSKQPFIEGTRDGNVVFHYEGKNPVVLEGVTVENARWMGELLGRLSDKQLSDAFRAAGWGDADVATYVRAMRERITQLKNLR
ncbi:MAG TPA: hypothetical protein VIG62_14135 [Blastocatellia bacterium]|jgi:hypothetical protein